MTSTSIRLTEYSHGSGCGCKIAPGVLEQILKTEIPQAPCPALLVGNQSKDDAAAFDLGNGTSVLSTTDFFMPIVDDAFEFGRIAATNALSDIYAMGGKPLMAIAILGWPIDKLPAQVARQVVEGGRSVCADAGIPLAGGHSIDAPEPIFGLAVTGLVENRFLKQNNTATSGCHLFLTKPLGIGIHATAQKKKLLDTAHSQIAPNAMCQLNKIGAELAQIEGIKALTDVTGFGLLGHLSEICEGSGISAIVNFDAVPTLPHTHTYLDMGCSPGGAQRNFDSYGDKIGEMSAQQRAILCDPQTSGGLLVVVHPEALEAFHQCTEKHGLSLMSIGETIPATSPLVQVR